MKITVLTENTISKNIEKSLAKELKAEHGLSLFIETENHKILFDMGQTNLFLENAKNLNINLKEVDFAVLSHGHYDHGGLPSSENDFLGITAFLNINKTSPIFINENAFSDNYNASKKFIGLDKKLLENPDFMQRAIFVGEEKEIVPKIKLNACNNKEKIIPINTDGLCQLKNGVFIPEDFSHEHYLLIEENKKKILISGCSHKGILNIVNWFKPDILIGGFHLKSLDTENQSDIKILQNLGETLSSYKTTFYTCHCTGESQFAKLKSILKEKVFYIATGDTLDL